MLRLGLVLIGLWSLHTQLSTAQRCYDTRGVQDQDIPCDPSASVSNCCAKTFVCLDNGLCAPGPNTTNAGFQAVTDFYRGSCTDLNWKDASCPQICRGADDTPNGQGLNACPGEGAGKYCCWRSDHDCCKDKDSIFDLGTANIQTTIGFAPSVGATSAVNSNTVSTAGTSSTTTASSTTLNSPATSSSEMRGSSSNSAAIGAGVGAGIGVPLLVGVVAAIILYRKKIRQQPEKRKDKDFVELKAELDGRGKSGMNSEAGGCRSTPIKQQYELDSGHQWVQELR